MTTPLEAALGYAAFCGVFPCTAKKMPIKIEGLFEHGFASATTDAAVITKTWTKYKAADIGLALPRGVLVVDVDVAKGKKGRDDFIRLFGCPPEEMATAVSTTVRGGWHVYFRFDLFPSTCPDARSRRASMSASAAWATSSRLPPAMVGAGFSHSYRRRSWRRRNGSWSG